MGPQLRVPLRVQSTFHQHQSVQQYARHDAAVLMSGEPGTGRGAFARYMHALSRRADEPLTTLTAASVTEVMLTQMAGINRKYLRIKKPLPRAKDRNDTLPSG